MLKVDENIERSVKPFMEFCDGTTTPFGKYKDDGEFWLNYGATSRYGYNTLPIYGVYVDRYLYKIFIGEAPHKDDSGNWVTYNKVPSFYTSSFAGAHYLEQEPDIPHIIRIETDEWGQKRREMGEEKRNSNNTKEGELTQKVVYCSFKTYITGLWHRIQKRFGRVSYYKGKHSNLLTWSKYPKQLQFVHNFEDDSWYFVRENDDWIWFTWFKKKGKWGLERKKRENDHCCCEA